jgi:hypothetical protein
VETVRTVAKWLLCALVAVVVIGILVDQSTESREPAPACVTNPDTGSVDCY